MRRVAGGVGGGGGGARIVPHLSGPLDPLVGDPLVAETDGAAEVENSSGGRSKRFIFCFATDAK